MTDQPRVKAPHDPTPTPPTLAGQVADQPRPGIGLCLSGGGYRAMLFHLGGLWRLNEAGLLSRLDVVTSVSGGSITAAALAVGWDATAAGGFGPAVVEPVRALARRTIDVGAVVRGILDPFRTVADYVAAALRKHLFGRKTLQHLPDRPRFLITAANVQTGALWYFGKDTMGDYRVGFAPRPAVELAAAVGSSAAFPPFLSPVRLKLAPGLLRPGAHSDLSHPPFTTRVVLSDGGVYDNLGLEPVFKELRTVLVSDGGAKAAPEGRPAGDWALHARRVVTLINNQVASLRQRVLIGAYLDASRDGAYWGIRTDIANYRLPDPLPCPHEVTLGLAAVPTRLAALDDALQEWLINWGYAVCDAALRAHVDHALPRGSFPYPRGV
jgi:NTE family protein